MRSAFLFLICGLLIGGCQTKVWLPTLNEGPWKGSTSFVEGTVKMTDVKTSGEGYLLMWSDFSVDKKIILANWIHDDESGALDIRMTEKGPIVYWSSEFVWGFKSSTTQVGRDLHVKTSVIHYYGETDLAFTLKGVFADDVPIPRAAQLKPNSLKVMPQPKSLPTVYAPPALKSSSFAERLKQFDGLFKQELISKEEYDKLRKEILKEL